MPFSDTYSDFSFIQLHTCPHLSPSPHIYFDTNNIAMLSLYKLLILHDKESFCAFLFFSILVLGYICDIQSTNLLEKEKKREKREKKNWKGEP